MPSVFQIIGLSLLLAIPVATAQTAPDPMASPSPSPVASPAPECPDRVRHVTLYRCVCRIEVALADGGVSSIPLAMNGQLTIFSGTELSGSCQGTILPDACNPTAINGMSAVGRYSCISVTTTDDGVQINW